MVGVSESHNIAVLVLLIIISCFLLSCECSNVEGVKVVQRQHRKSLTVTDDGEVTAVDINHPLPYTLHFFTLEPNSLFLPVLLHARMLFYVHTGSGQLSWADEEQTRKVDIKRGDLYSLNPGSVFYVHCNLEPERQKLRFYAIFANTDEDQYEPSIGAYSRISDMITGFDGKILQAAFKVPEEVVEEMTNATSPPPIVHAVPPKETATSWEWEARFEKAFLSGRKPVIEMNGKKKKKKHAPFNIYDAKPDFSNCNGWSLSVNDRNLKDSNVGVFMVNLTKGSMMGPHWNPMAMEVSIVLEGEGMIRVGCSSSSFSVKDKGCKSMRFKVEEGDVFVVPRFHPMAQISFNNGSFVFMGFSTAVKKNYPQFMAGKRSVLRVLDKAVLAASFNVTNSTIDQLLASQEESIILDCTSCAEEEEMKMEEEIEREKQKEEEAEARKKEEEARKRREEEEARKREEEEAREREREEKEEEARRREQEQEEEAKRREEEAEREEDKRRREQEREEEAKRREEEEAKREEDKRRREQEREEEAKRREEEAEREEDKKRREQEREEEAKRREEEAEREEDKKRREQEREEEARRQEEEAEEREEEMRREEEARRREEEEMREEEKRRREKEQEEEASRQEEEATEREREEAAEREEEEERETQPEERESEQEAARRQEKERIEREKQEEAAARAREKEKAKQDPEEPQKVNSSAERLRILKFASYIV